MSKLVESTIALIAETQTSEEAAKVISKAHPKLSEKEAANVVKDLKDFAAGTMSISELDHWLNQRGL